MAQYAVEFDFIEDETGGGRFVAAGGSGFQIVSGLAARGDIEAATALYEESAHSRRDALLAEAMVSSTATRRGLIEVLKRARDFAGAAALCASLGAHGEAAALLEQANDLPGAAEAWLKAGQVGRAAAAIERTGDFARALELYRQVGDREAEARCLTRLGRHHEAAEAWRALQNPHAELELLLAIPADAPERRGAILRACELLDAQGHPNKALSLLGTEMRANPKLRADFAFQTGAIRLLRRCGRHQDADRLLAQVQGQVGASASPTPAAAPVPAAPPTPDAAAPTEGYGYLKAIPFFGELALEDMKDLYRLARRILVPAGMVLIHKGARDTGLTLLLEGEVDVYSGPGSDARHLNTLGPGGWLGEISLIEDAPASAEVRARTNVRALLISRAHFQRFLETHDAAALRIWRLFAQSLAERVRALSA